MMARAVGILLLAISYSVAPRTGALADVPASRPYGKFGVLLILFFCSLRF
jgi:hypothetical protein